MSNDPLDLAYQEEHRVYHNKEHIEDCLRKLTYWPLPMSMRERGLLTLAILYHDVVYDPRASDNEERSAEFAEQDMIRNEPESKPEDVAEVKRLVLLTKKHEAGIDDHVGQVLVSIDLSILAADPEYYDEYVRQIRAEYSFVPEDVWRKRRAEFLQRFLNRPYIFPSSWFENECGDRARNNMRRELESLRADA